MKNALYGLTMKLEIIHLRKSGKKQVETANMLGCSQAYVSLVMKEYREWTEYYDKLLTVREALKEAKRKHLI